MQLIKLTTSAWNLFYNSHPFLSPFFPLLSLTRLLADFHSQPALFSWLWHGSCCPFWGKRTIYRNWAAVALCEFLHADAKRISNWTGYITHPRNGMLVGQMTRKTRPPFLLSSVPRAQAHDCSLATVWTNPISVYLHILVETRKPTLAKLA